MTYTPDDLDGVQLSGKGDPDATLILGWVRAYEAAWRECAGLEPGSTAGAAAWDHVLEATSALASRVAAAVSGRRPVGLSLEDLAGEVL